MPGVKVTMTVSKSDPVAWLTRAAAACSMRLWVSSAENPAVAADGWDFEGLWGVFTVSRLRRAGCGSREAMWRITPINQARCALSLDRGSGGARPVDFAAHDDGLVGLSNRVTKGRAAD